MERPVRPLDSECCGSGCKPCIFDIYEQQLQRYYSSKCCEGDPPKICSNNCLSQDSYSAFKLTNIKKDVIDTFKYTFKFWKKCDEPCDQNCRLIIKPGQHLFMQGDVLVDGKLVNKPYAVFLNHKDKLSFDTVIKIWPNGIMSTYFRNLRIGDLVHWRGPFGKFILCHNWDHILLIGQGTGISPLYSVVWDILQDCKCETRLRLFHCCHDHDNINLRYELHDLATYWNFKYDIFLGEDTSKKFKKLHYERTHTRMMKESDIKDYIAEENAKGCGLNYRVLITGGPEFIETVKLYLKNSGVDPSVIHRF